jgi:hypothetical protein
MAVASLPGHPQSADWRAAYAQEAQVFWIFISPQSYRCLWETHFKSHSRLCQKDNPTFSNHLRELFNELRTNLCLDCH